MDGRMFHFKRRTLWIIIYITIPLIIILNRLVPEPDDTSFVQQAAPVSWSIDDITSHCSGIACALELEGSARVIVSVIMNEAPINSIDVPKQLSLTTYRQGGYLIASAESLDSSAAIDDIWAFFEMWVPKNSSVRWVMSGSDTKAFLKSFEEAPETYGNGMSLDMAPVNALTVLEAPKLGEIEQLAFLIWIEILKGRLSGYDVAVAWDHQRARSFVTFNTALDNSAFGRVTQAEFDKTLNAYNAAANTRMRDQAQLHRYALSAVVYDLPFTFFVQQPERLQALTLDIIESMREETFGQISQSQ
jgi:hypothetical protein